MNTITLCVLSATLGILYAQVPGIGKCPAVETQKELDLNKYLGDWYEIYKFKAEFENGQECIKANYQLKEDGKVRVFNDGITPKGEKITAEGEAYVPDKNEPAKLKVRFTEVAPYGNYWVLDTDYETYTLIYSCASVVDVRFEFAWILAREKTISDEIKNKLFAKLASFNVKTENFMKTDQTASYCPK